MKQATYTNRDFYYKFKLSKLVTATLIFINKRKICYKS
jgi:hypothetical protein